MDDSPVKSSNVKSLRLAIYIGFSVVFVLVVFILHHSIEDSSRMKNDVQQMVHVNNKKISILHEMHTTLMHRTGLIEAIANSTDPFVLDERLMQHQTLAGQFIKLKDTYLSLAGGDVENNLFKRFLREINTNQQYHQNLVDTRTSITDDRFKDAIKKIRIQQNMLFQYIDELVKIQEARNANYADQLIEESQSDYLFHLYLGMIVLSVYLFVAVKVSRFVFTHAENLQEYNSKVELAAEIVRNSSQAKSDFIASMSHEIRTPLTAIRGAIALVDQEVSSQGNSGLKNLTNIALKNTNRLMVLLNDILDFSKIESGKLLIEPADFLLYNELLEIMDLYMPQAQEKQLDLDLIFHVEKYSLVYLDKNRLRQILVNLIGNALKFTSRGFIKIECEILSSSSSPYLYVQVIDSGIGISREMQDSIFERFKQADSSTTRNYGGTGLGLSISKRLVELMDGEIGVHTNPTGGSTFWFKVPTQLHVYHESA